MTAASLARRLQLLGFDCSERTPNNWVEGRNTPRPQVMKTVATILGCSAADIWPSHGSPDECTYQIPTHDYFDDQVRRDLREYIKTAESGIDLVGDNIHVVIMQISTLPNLLLQAAERQVPIRVAQPRPDCVALATRSREQGFVAGYLGMQVGGCLARLADLTAHPNVEVATTIASKPTTIIRMDGQMYVFDTDTDLPAERCEIRRISEHIHPGPFATRMSWLDRQFPQSITNSK